MGWYARRKMRILAAGGDGTVAWILKTVRELALDPEPHVAVMPLGTGNDLSLSFGWGNTFLKTWINVRLLSAEVRKPCVAVMPLGTSNDTLRTIDRGTANPGTCKYREAARG